MSEEEYEWSHGPRWAIRFVDWLHGEPQSKNNGYGFDGWRKRWTHSLRDRLFCNFCREVRRMERRGEL